MSRGVPLDNGLRTERLIEWYYEEKHAEITQTMLLVAAVTGQDNINEFVKRYINAVIPTDKANEDFLELNQQILQEESSKQYQVKRVILHGEDE